MRSLVIFVLLATGCAFASLKPLRGVRRVLVLGDSITYSGGYVDAIDAYVRLHDPKAKTEFINIGLPSETVSGLTEPNHAGGAFPRPDLHERLDRALAKIKPDMVVACYGMNDAIYHPFDEARFQKYKDGIQWLREKVLRSGAKLWLLTPPPFDPQPVKSELWPAGKDSYPSGHTFEGYDGVLARYSEWLLSHKRWNVVDIHTPIDAYLADRRKTDPKFILAGDGVHMNEIGHMLIAREVLKAWGAPADTLPPVEPAPTTKFYSLIQERQQILKDAWLTEVGHKRPGMAVGLPIAQAQAKAAEIEAQIREILAHPRSIAG